LEYVGNSRIDDLPIYRIGYSNILCNTNELNKYIRYNYVKSISEAHTNITSIEQNVIRRFTLNNMIIKIYKYNKDVLNEN